MGEVQRMKSLVEISQIVTGSDNFFEIKDIVVQKMLDVVHPAKACVNLFFNKDYSYSHLACSSTLNYIPKLFPKNEEHGTKIDFNLYPKYIHESVFEKKVVVVKNIFEDKRAEGEEDLALKEEYVGRIVVPFIYNDEVIGFMTCYLTESDEVSQDDIDFMIQVASLMALSISTTEKNNEINELVDKLRKSISNINKGITALYSTQDIYSYLKRIVYTVVDTTESLHGFLGIYATDGDGNILGQKISVSYPDEKIYTLLPLMPSIIRKKHIFEIKNNQPLIVCNEVIGQNSMFIKIDIDSTSRLILFCAGDEAYDEDDKNTISILAKQIKHSINTYDYYLAEEKQKKMDEDLSMISKQQELIMSHNNNFSSFVQKGMYCYHKPSKVVGGDFYTAIDNGDRISFIIADVMGHGIVSNYIVAMIKGAFEVLSRHQSRPSDILKLMNEYLYEELDSMDIFFTAIVGVLDKKAMTLEIANAGHYFPIVLYSDGRINNDQEVARGVSVGVQQNSCYKNIMYKLNEIKELCFFTDGILEMKNNRKEEYGIEKLTEFIYNNYLCSREETLNNLKSEIKRYSIDPDNIDDILVLFIKNDVII